MSASGIQAKIKKGLSKAVLKTGSASSDLVYAVKVSKTGGNSPLDPPVITKTPTLLVDAIFTSYDRSLLNDNIKQGDRKLVSNNNVEIKIGEIITQGSLNYIVIDVDVKAPTSDVLVYISQCRLR